MPSFKPKPIKKIKYNKKGMVPTGVSEDIYV